MWRDRRRACWLSWRCARGGGADAESTVIEAVDQRKQRRLPELAGEYLAERPSAGDARIDVIAIAVGVDGRVLSVRHVENAVEA